jgi:arylsulfatase A-like enzyme
MNKLTRRDFLRTAGGIAAVSMLNFPLKASAESGSGKPNVLFIFDDQLRADACSVYGGKNIQTPNIDRLASQGVRFTNALSTCPLCTPFRGMLQTGRFPTHSGILVNFVEVNPKQRCLAHIFRDAGYQTGYIGKWHLAAGMDKNLGKFDPGTVNVWSEEFKKQNPDTEFVPPGPARLGYDHWQAYNFHGSFNDYWYYGDEKKRIETHQYETDAQTDEAIEFMRKTKESQKPFFLMVAPHPPHPPFKPEWCPKGYLEKITNDIHFSPNVPADHPRRKDLLQIRCYYAMCKNFDDNIGRITKFLDESGLAANTIVVLTADHGEQHGSHNLIDKMVPYAESVNIPLIMRWPAGISAGSVCDAVFAPVDHMRTLAALCGLQAPSTCDGVDFAPLLREEGDVQRDAVLMANYSSHWDFFQTGTKWPEWRAVRTKQHTYVKWLSGKEELYNNTEDPYQMNNLAERKKDLSMLDKMRAKMKELLSQAHDEFLPGTAYADWYDDKRNLIKTGLGPVK